MNDLISRLSQAVATSRSKNHVRLTHETVAEIIDALEGVLPAAPQPEAEPVAWRYRDPGEDWRLSDDGPWMAYRKSKVDCEIQPLYTRPTPAPVVPAEGLVEALRAQQPAAPVSGVTVQEAARVLLADDTAICKMAEAVHNGPLGADDHWFSAARPQGAWCVDVVRAALSALEGK